MNDPLKKKSCIRTVVFEDIFTTSAAVLNSYEVYSVCFLNSLTKLKTLAVSR